MQFLADLLRTRIVNIGMEEVSALGAAYLAGLQQSIFRDIGQLESLNIDRKQFCPNVDVKDAQTSYEGWKEAVSAII
jgi:glycerol kinase